MKTPFKKQLETLLNTFRKRIVNDKQFRHCVLLEMYDSQTEDEQTEEETIHSNLVGFNTWDARALTRIAGELSTQGKLSAADESVLRKRLPKYWSQFTVVSPVDPCSLRVQKKSPGKLVVVTKEAA